MNPILELLKRQPMIALFVIIWLVGVVNNILKAQRKSRESQDRETRPQSLPQQQTDNALQGRAVGGNQRGAVVASMGTGENTRLTEQSLAPMAEASSVQSTLQRGTASDQASPLPFRQQPVAQPAMRQQTASQQTVSQQTVSRQTVRQPIARKTPEQIAQEMRRMLGLEPDVRVVTPPPVRPVPASEVPQSSWGGASTSEARMQRQEPSHVGEILRDRHMRKTKVGQSSSRGPGAIGNLGGRVHASKKRDAVERRYPMSELRRAIVMNEILSPPVSLRPDGRPLL